MSDPGAGIAACPPSVPPHPAPVAPPEPFRLFRLRVTAVARTDLDDGGLRVRAFRPDTGVRTVHRT